MAILKLFHVLAIFIWVGSLLSLTRLLGYYPKEQSLIQESLRKIYKKIYLLVDLPSMIFAIVLGVLLFIYNPNPINWKTAGWFHMKMTFSFLLVICDLICAHFIFSLNKKTIKSALKFKIHHVITALILIGVLASIYVVRNKEKEIQERIIEKLELNKVK